MKNKNDNYIRIRKQKLSFYKRIEVDNNTRILIKVINYLQQVIK